jgi:predicted small secreted protein
MKIKALLLAIAVLALTGCNNTVQGFGKDMQQNGQKVENAADNHNQH